MLRGFLFGLALWVGPAVIAWLIAASSKLTGRHQH